MGAAYTFAHKEGHNPMIYRKWLRGLTGNIFENWVMRPLCVFRPTFVPIQPRSTPLQLPLVALGNPFNAQLA